MPEIIALFNVLAHVYPKRCFYLSKFDANVS